MPYHPVGRELPIGPVSQGLLFYAVGVKTGKPVAIFPTMKLDLHLHTRERSFCAGHSVDQMLEAAQNRGLAGVAITDHDRLVPLPELEQLGRRYAPLRLFTGVEVTVGDEHLLVHGVRHPALEGGQLDYPELWQLVRAEGGLLTLAHPFRYCDTVNLDLEAFPPDAVELHSVNTGRCLEDRILELARRLNLVTVTTSDAHEPLNVGVFSVELDEPVETDAELVATIRRGSFAPRRLEHRIRAVNAEVELRETIIREMIAAGHDKHHFHRVTGHWEGYFECVQNGGSYLI